MKRVLLIDDDESVLILFQRAIERLSLPIELVSTTNPLTGIESVCKEDFDLVFLDLKLEFMSGEEVFQRIRRIEDIKKSSTPIVIFSGFIDHATAPKVLKHGFASFVFKPSKYDDAFFSSLFKTFGLIK